MSITVLDIITLINAKCIINFFILFLKKRPALNYAFNARSNCFLVLIQLIIKIEFIFVNAF